MSECPEYRAWEESETGMVKSRECSWFWAAGNGTAGTCENSMSPHAGQSCPWEGRPEKKDAE